MALYLTEDDVTSLLPMDDALTAVESVLRAQAEGKAINESRRRVRAAGTTMHVMSGAVTGVDSANSWLGLKCYSVSRNGARFIVNLFNAESGELSAIIEADRLGQIRTGAASGVATKYMSRADAKTIGIYGTGWQARTQLVAVCKVRPPSEIKVYSRSAEKREKFCDEMRNELKFPSITPVSRPQDAAEGCDVIITITSSREPVLLGEWLAPGTHINAAGGNSLLRRELDDEVIRRSSAVVVDSLEQAKIEAGELVSAVEKGLLAWEGVCELRHVVTGNRHLRSGSEDITLFKSLGIAIEDVAAAAVVYEKARVRGIGREI